MQDLAGKVAVVTGAASGIGLALAEAAAAAGMSVVLADVEAAALAGAAEHLGATGAEVLAVPTDVSDAAAVDALAAATLERFGAAHLVCNNAGVGGTSSDHWRGPLEVWPWVIGVNLMGVVHGVRAFLPTLEAQGEGHVVNTASIAGVTTGVLGPYSATKHAVVALSEDLFLDQTLRGTGVGVSVLCPGWVRTSITASDRNWPVDRLGPKPPDDPLRQTRIGMVERLVAEGLPPARVADLVLACVRRPRFWIFPHPDWVDLAVQRAHGMAEGRDPDLPAVLGLELPAAE